MPNLPQQQTIVQYVANSAQSQYTFAFYAPLPTDIQVFYQSSTAIPVPASQILNINADYTVTYNADPTTGGYITLLFTPVTGYYLTINRQVAASLNTNFANAQNFSGANLDTALDRLLLLCQQNLNYNLQRNLSYVINTYLPNASPYTQLPPLPANYIWIGSGTGIVAAQIASSPSASVLQSLLANNSPGTDGSRLVGYYDAIHSTPTTVQAYLASLFNSPTINTPSITGIVDGSNAAAGIDGEVIVGRILFSAPVVFASNAATDLIALTLSAGDWDIWGNLTLQMSGGLANTCAGWISTVSGTQPDGSFIAANVSNTNSINLFANAVPGTRYISTATSTIYLSGRAAVNAGTINASGAIYARRRR